jgi:DNA-binding NtrC family response regulator
MSGENKIKLFLVDDDILFLKMLEIEMQEQADFEIETYSSGEDCICNLLHNPQLVVLDYQLDGIDQHAMNGLETLDKIKTLNPLLPVVMLSAQDKIEVAINCMHHKALDYVVKSETAFIRLQKIIADAFNYKRMENELNWYMNRM